MVAYVVRRWGMCLALLLLTATAAFAQAQPEVKDYTPREGQAGKDVIWLPTRETVVDKMLDLAQVTPQDYVIDLGSGDGRTVIAAAKRGARALGIEYNPDLVEFAKRNAAKEGVSDRTHFIKADIFESDFSQASVITLFLLPELNLKLRPQILNLKPGTRIVSNTFPMGEWQPDQTADVTGECATYCTALFWIVPAKVEGEWKLPQGRLVLRQNFQTFSGTLDSDGTNMQIASGQLKGDVITFSAGGVVYTGRVRGNEMEGEFKASGKTGTWRAVRAN
jgi:SAM-dependent methyltransferase